MIAYPVDVEKAKYDVTTESEAEPATPFDATASQVNSVARLVKELRNENDELRKALEMACARHSQEMTELTDRLRSISE